MPKPRPPSPLLLKAHRDARGWSVRELAERAGVDFTTVYRLERDSVGGVSWATLVALATAFGLDDPGALFRAPNEVTE